MGFYKTWIVPRLLDLAMRNRLLDHYRQRTVEMARGLVLEVGVGSGLNLPLYGPAVAHVIALDPFARIAAFGTPASDSCRRSGVADQGFGGTSPLCCRGLRNGRDDLDFVLDPESDRGAHRNEAGSQTGRAIALRRARVVTGKPSSPLAASVDAILEADQRRLSPRSQDGRIDPQRRVRN